MNRLLITGGSGLLALNWACTVRAQFDVVLGTHRRAVSLRGVRAHPLDLGAPERLIGQLREMAPDIIVHAAGMTSVEHCERHPQEATHANVELAKHVAAAAHVLGIRLVHVSTDHLFAGDRPLVSEQARPEPLNVYARTKLEAERVVQEKNAQALIVRTNFFGWGHAYRQSFSDWIINSLRAGREITMFDDVYFTPMLSDELALVVHEVLAREATGIYNVGGEERLSKFEFATRLAEHFNLPTTMIKAGRISESTLSVKRPHDMSLDISKVRALLGRSLGQLDRCFAELRRQEDQGRAVELRNAVMEN